MPPSRPPIRRRVPENRDALHLVAPGSLDRPTGGDRYDARMADGLRALGWDVTVHGLDGEFPRRDDSAPDALGAVLAGLPAESRVLVDGLVLGGLPGPAREHGTRIRILALVHHPLADETGLPEEKRARLAESERRALEAVAGVVVTSRFTARRVADRFGVAQDRIRVVVPGTDPAPLAEGPGPGEPPALFCLGSVIPRKGQDVLVAALEELRKLPWTLTCAGSLTADPGFARRVQRSARDAGLADRIRFPGAVPDSAVTRIFHSCSLFVLPSRYEGYGMALAEALARGLPLVSTTGGAIPGTVPADAGILVPPGDPGSLAAALASLLGPGGDTRRRELSRAARRHGARLPDWREAASALGRAVVALTAPEDESETSSGGSPAT